MWTRSPPLFLAAGAILCQHLVDWFWLLGYDYTCRPKGMKIGSNDRKNSTKVVVAIGWWQHSLNDGIQVGGFKDLKDI